MPSIEYTDLDYKIYTGKSKGGEPRFYHALKGFSGSVKSGKLTAVVGPSGCGKSTLMNILAGRISAESNPGSLLSGTVSIDNKVVDPVRCRSEFGYVMSDDTLLGTSTPKECFQFVTEMRMSTLESSAKLKKATGMVDYLALGKCQDTFVGHELLKGISNGERKRTSIGVELLGDPSIFYLDEPTTGLDSYTALELVRHLRELANEGRCVMCVIHQPSSEIVELFDEVVVLCKGSLVFSGSMSSLNGHFATLGFERPAGYNLLDHVMYLLQTWNEDELKRAVDVWSHRSSQDKTAIIEARQGNSPVNHKNGTSSVLKSSISPQGSGQSDSLSPLVNKYEPAPFVKQIKELIVRDMRNIWRDKSLLVVRVVITVFMSLVFGCVFYQVGQDSGSGVIDSSHVGALTNVAFAAMMSNGNPFLVNFALERPVLLREHASGLYSIGAYFLAKILSEIPLMLGNGFIMVIITYYMMGFQGNLGIIFVGYFLIGLAAASIALLLGSSVADAKRAVELSFLAYMPQMLFAGLFIRITYIPVWLQWVQYVCFIKYGLDVMYIGEFGSLTGHETLFANNNVDQSMLVGYIFITLAFALVFKCGALVLLKRRSKSVY